MKPICAILDHPLAFSGELAKVRSENGGGDDCSRHGLSGFVGGECNRELMLSSASRQASFDRTGARDAEFAVSRPGPQRILDSCAQFASDPGRSVSGGVLECVCCEKHRSSQPAVGLVFFFLSPFAVYTIAERGQ